MSQFKKVTAKKAADIIVHYEMDEEAAAYLEEDMSPFNFVKSLIGAELYSEAVKFLAHALPKRESVWWACQSAKTDHSSKANTDALTAAETWVMTPNEEHRKSCMENAEKDKLTSPASWAALAAFWSSGSIADDSVAQIPPPPFQYAQAVSGAVNLAAATKESVDDAFKILIKLGIDIANGGGGN